MTKYSGRVMGAHQHIDRVARRQLQKLLPDNSSFPVIKDILRFEGKNGPDGIKVKSPARNEPWHYLNPLADEHTEYKEILDNHFSALVTSLKEANNERAAFEAAWLAHAIVDGLTPAHHYPYEAIIEDLRSGKSKESRTTYKEKMIFKGDTFSKTIANMYTVYGPKGLFTAHHVFEFGVMLLLRPLRLADAQPSTDDIHDVKTTGIHNYFVNIAREVAISGLYEQYLKKGWTPKLANRIRHQLAPRITKTVTLIWFAAATEAGLCD
jgi:hypothetical protein